MGHRCFYSDAVRIMNSVLQEHEGTVPAETRSWLADAVTPAESIGTGSICAVQGQLLPEDKEESCTEKNKVIDNIKRPAVSHQGRNDSWFLMCEQLWTWWTTSLLQHATSTGIWGGKMSSVWLYYKHQHWDVEAPKNTCMWLPMQLSLLWQTKPSGWWNSWSRTCAPTLVGAHTNVTTAAKPLLRRSTWSPTVALILARNFSIATSDAGIVLGRSTSCATCKLTKARRLKEGIEASSLVQALMEKNWGSA